MADTLRESFIGQVIHKLSGGRVLQYPDEKEGFEIPARYRRDDHTKALLERRSRRIQAKKGAQEEWKKLQKAREEKPVRIAPVPKHTGGEQGYIDAAEKRAAQQAVADERPVRIGDVEAGRRRSDGSSATRVNSNEEDEEQALGLEGDDDDPNIVTWYGPNDPENPQNWSMIKKLHVTFCICLITIAVYMGSSIVTPGIMGVMTDLRVAQVPATLSLSLFVAGYGTGPLLWSPLTEIPAIGRNPPYILTLLIFVILQVPTALVKNFAGICVLRFLAGFFGSPPLATGGASLQDMYSIKARTHALGIWGVAASGGPSLGPIVSGFAIQANNWRWAFWIMLWLSGGALLFLAISMPETSSENILYRRAARLRTLTGNQDLKSQGQIMQEKVTFGQRAKNTLIKPFSLNFKEPVIFANNLFIGFVYAVLYAWFEAFPLVYVDMYGFSLGVSQLPFIALFIGAFCGFLGICAWHRWIWCREFDRTEGHISPEKRLQPAFVGALCLPACLFWFAWSSGRTHWMAPVVSTAIFGVGASCLFNPIINYLTDAYPTEAASVLASNDFIRSAFGAGMPLAAHGLFVNLKVDWGTSLLGFVSLLFLPLPFFLYFYGPTLRARSPRAASPS